MITNDIKQKLGEQTQKLEAKASELWTDFSPNYTNLEPWQRGLLLIGILALLVFIIYYFTKKDKQKDAITQAKAEAAAEEKMMRQLALLRKLKETTTK